MVPYFNTLCFFLLIFLTQSSTTRAHHPHTGATSQPTSSPGKSTRTGSSYFSKSHSPTPPQLSALVHSLSTYVSDTLSAFFVAVTTQSTNETNKEAQKNISGPPGTSLAYRLSPVAWLRFQFKRLRIHFFSQTRDQSVLSQTTGLAASAVEDVLVKLIDTHNVLLMASIRDRPWYIRGPLYLYRRYSISHSTFANRVFHARTDALGDNILLQQALVQFQNRLKQNDEVQPLASTIVDALEPANSKPSESNQSENTFLHMGYENPLSTVSSYIRIHLPYALHHPVDAFLSATRMVHKSFQWFCHSTWKECWRMHVETMYRRSAPTALECTTLYVRLVAVSLAKHVLSGVDTVVRFFRALANTVAGVLDKLCSALALEPLPVPGSGDDMSYTFFFQFVSLCRMALLLFIQLVRLVWTLTIYKRSFLFVLACAFFYGHWWRFLCFLFQLLRSRNVAGIDMINTRGVRRFWKVRNQDVVAPPVSKTGGNVGRRASGSKGQTRRIAEDNVDVGKGSKTPVDNTTDGDTEAHGDAGNGNISLSEESSWQDDTSSPPARRNTGWSSARASLSEPVRHESQNLRKGSNPGAARYATGTENHTRNEHIASDDSSVVYVGRVDGVEGKENNGEIGRSLSRPQTRLGTNAPTTEPTGMRLRSNSNGAGKRAHRTGFDFAMRLLDINSQTAHHAREAMQLVCADAATHEPVDSEERMGTGCRKQGVVKKASTAPSPDRMVQYAQSVTRPRRSRRKVRPLPEDE